MGKLTDSHTGFAAEAAAALEAARYTTVEETFHKEMWGLANNSLRLERALGEARELAYMILAHFDSDEDTTLAYAARQWIENFGRDKRKETRVLEIRKERKAATDA